MKSIPSNERIRARRLLRGARRLIACGNQRYICTAIGFVPWRDDLDTVVAWRLKNEIRTRLGRHSLLENWLDDNSPEYRSWIEQTLAGSVTPSRSTLMAIQKEHRQYRLRWIDSMIGELT